jgi:hypothetical protein
MSRYPVLRKSSWFDLKTQGEVFGIQIKTAKARPWQHLSEKGNPCLYSLEEMRDLKLKQFRKEIKQAKKGIVEREEVKYDETISRKCPLDELPLTLHMGSIFHHS